MPVEKDLKRLVRARMRKTGESYTTARARLRAKRSGAGQRAAPAKPPPDFAALAGMSDAAVAKRTGRDWKQWVALLDRAGAAKLPHAEIAKWLRAEHDLPPWWSQTVTVAYERIRGLREKGQRRGGTFTVNKSKVYPVPLSDLWTAFVRCDAWIGDGALRMSKATRHRSMRMRWSDDTPVTAMFFEKGPGKSQVQLQHDGFETREEAARLRAFWTERLAALGEVLTAGEAGPRRKRAEKGVPPPSRRKQR